MEIYKVGMLGMLLKMQNMFRQSEFNGDISSWDVRNVTQMDGIFTSSKFNGDISRWKFDSLD